jgi:death-on-curing protein
MIEPVWIYARDALALHERLLSIRGGAEGLCDLTLLESDRARPRQLLAYADQSGIVDLAVAYTFGIVRNHPLVDGNKRTGFVVGILFTEINGLRFIASEEEAVQAVLQLTAGDIDEAEYVAFLRQWSGPSSVETSDP